jgi:hypothetical protein
MANKTMKSLTIGENTYEIYDEVARASIPRSSTVTLLASNWEGNNNLYSQEVVINTVTANSKIDLYPSAAQIIELKNAETALMIENNEGTIICWAIGNKPTNNLKISVLIQEVILV